MKKYEVKATPMNQQVSSIAKTLALATLQNDFSYKEFVEYYKMHMVREAKKEKKKSTVVEISARTGIDRRFIAPYLNSEQIHVKPSKVTRVFDDVLAYCKKNNTKKILKNDDKESFEVLCQKHANGSLTPKAIYTELWRLGLMKDVGTHYKLKKPKSAEKKVAKATKRMVAIGEAITQSVDGML
ncbi:hypothetical protein [Marinicella litoralis]|uniref:Uncharacterized protein n=1 Tax=Marinicella litoralis TaxID=644220 RepID=A0A4R6XYM1_9GAMM|nr:hypothetical protein [Marinicella litoralis]TDR23414.1 hypothetical protein C8D91_0275 [Marinicella litoralis]